ncbi:hypothetical protein QZH41_015097, partial [Actinostola sp. cb2023]
KSNMADKADCEDEFDLELDIVFNEFEDEFQQECNKTTESVYRQADTDECTTEFEENSKNSELKNVCFTTVSDDKNSNKTEVILDTEHSQPSEDEGELLKSEEELELKTDNKLQKVQNEISAENPDKILSRGDDSLKRKIDNNNTLFEEDIQMDIDEDGLLDSKDESQPRGEKKCKVEETKRETGSEDQIMKEKRKTRGGRKKKKKTYAQKSSYHERKIRPVIGRLFRPLTANEEDTAEFLANQLADRLEEEKDDLILRVVQILGHKKSIEIFQQTKKLQVDGGMQTSWGGR